MAAEKARTAKIQDYKQKKWLRWGQQIAMVTPEWREKINSMIAEALEETMKCKKRRLNWKQPPEKWQEDTMPIEDEVDPKPAIGKRRKTQLWTVPWRYWTREGRPDIACAKLTISSAYQGFG